MAWRPEPGASMVVVFWMTLGSRFVENAKHTKNQRAPDPVRYYLLPVQGPRLKKNIDFLMAMTSQRHENAANDVSKRLPRLEPEHKKYSLSQIMLSRSTFNGFSKEFDGKAARQVHNIFF